MPVKEKVVNQLRPPFHPYRHFKQAVFLPALLALQQINLPNITLAGGLLLVIGLLALAALALILLVLLIVRAKRRDRQPPPPAKMVPVLKSSDGQIYFQLQNLEKDGLVIGRDEHDANLRIDDSVPNADTVSKVHARIYRDADSGFIIIEDLNSANGIFINGRRAPKKNLLKDGWSVNLGQVALTYQDGESDTGPLE
jgi:hypothetical protein